MRSRTWLAGAALLVLVCVPGVLTGQDAEIVRIEVNQAIGVQKDNARKFVAGKPAVVRALLAAPVVVNEAATQAVVSRNGEEVATLSPSAASGAVNAVDFQCPSLAACGEWAAGDYTFQVTVNGATRVSQERFVERKPVRILAVPVKATYAGTVTQVRGDDWKSTGRFTRDTYPVASDRFQWELGPELDASDRRFDLETDDGRAELWEALAKLMPANCTAEPAANGCYELIIGFISDRPNGYPNGTLQGYTMGKPANVAVASDEDVAATVAHEIAHTYGIGDTYNGGSFRCGANPAPDSFTGKDWDDRTREVRCTQGRTALGEVSATRVPASAHAYEVGGRGLLGDVAEFMGSGGRQEQFWISADAYDWIFDRSGPGAARASTARKFSMQRYIEFFGYIEERAASSAGVRLEPWASFDDDFVWPDSTGPLMVAAVDVGGRRLATQAFTVEHLIAGTKGRPPVTVNPAPFEGVMRFPEGTAAFQIVKNNVVITTIPVTANAPVVSDVTPADGSVVNGNFVIRWNATDRDGGPLYYTIDYIHDIDDEQADWVRLATDITATSWLENFDDLPGGERAMIRVTATDGVNAGSDESPVFRVLPKAPEVYISNAAGTHPAGQELELSAEVFDLQDEDFDDERIEWTSSIWGRLGNGAAIVVEGLPVGDHVITAWATNSRGLRGTDTVLIRVR